MYPFSAQARVNDVTLPFTDNIPELKPDLPDMKTVPEDTYAAVSDCSDIEGKMLT